MQKQEQDRRRSARRRERLSSIGAASQAKLYSAIADAARHTLTETERKGVVAVAVALVGSETKEGRAEDLRRIEAKLGIGQIINERG